MRVLSFQALGLVGPLGMVSAGLGSLALGGPLMLAVMAGLGAGALAARLFQRDIENLGRASHAIALDKAIGSIHAAALKLSETRLDELQQDLDRTKRAIQELTRTAVPAVGGGFILPLEKEQQLNQLIADRLVFQRAITEEQVRQEIALDRMIDAAIAKAPKGLVPQVVGGGVLPGTFGARFLAAEEATAGRPAAAAAGGLIAIMEQLSGSFKAGKISVETHAAAAELAALRMQMAAVSLIHGVGALVQGAIAGGGGVGGFLGGALGLVGGIVGIANPIAGALLSAGGGIISTLASRPIPVVDRTVQRELRDLRQEIREVLISVSFTGPERPLAGIRYGLDRQTRRDAVPRLP